MAGSTAVAKPRLRNLGIRAWSIALGTSIFAASAFAVFFKTYVLEARKRHYKEFYETYDDEKEFAAMKKAGLFKGFEK